MLRKRIQELQHYRRMGLTTAADIDKFEMDSIRRVRMQPLLHVVRFASSFLHSQVQLKTNLSRDYYASERLNQLRGGTGRKCGCAAYHP